MVSKKYDYIEENECQKSDTKGKSYCFNITWVNYTDENIDTIRKLEHVYKPNRSSIKYKYVVKYVYINLKTHTEPYIQAYVQFTTRVSPSTVANIYRGCRVMKTKMISKKLRDAFEEVEDEEEDEYTRKMREMYDNQQKICDEIQEICDEIRSGSVIFGNTSEVKRETREKREKRVVVLDLEDAIRELLSDVNVNFYTVEEVEEVEDDEEVESDDL
jgi:hypothetical protein